MHFFKGSDSGKGNPLAAYSAPNTSMVRPRVFGSHRRELALFFRCIRPLQAKLRLHSKMRFDRAEYPIARANYQAFRVQMHSISNFMSARQLNLQDNVDASWRARYPRYKRTVGADVRCGTKAGERSSISAIPPKRHRGNDLKSFGTSQLRSSSL
jgi:hypothetical protein